MMSLKKLPLRALLLAGTVFLGAALILSGCPGTGADPGDSFRSVDIKRNETTLTLSWEAAPDAEGYRLYITENHEDTRQALPFDLDSPVYIVTGTNSGSIYYFWVKAVIDGVEAEDWWARGRTAMPVFAPSNIILSRTYTSIYVFWDEVMGAQSYEVYYSQINKSGNADKWTGPIEGTSTEIQDLKNNVSYYVWVRAMGEDGPSPFSEVRNATTGAPKKPDVPVLSWTIRMKNAVGAIWSPAENAVSYDFCYGTGTDPSTGTIVNVRDTVCVVEDLPRNVNYRMWVRGRNAQWLSDWTAVCEAQTGQGFPEHIEGTYFSRWPVDTRGGAPYYMDGYQVGKVRDMYRDFPFNKEKFTDPKYNAGLPAYLVDAGVTRDLPGGEPYDDDDQYVLYLFSGFMGIVRAVLEKQPANTLGAMNYTVLELFKTTYPAWNYTTVKFSYARHSNSYLRGVNEYPLSGINSLTQLTPALLKTVGGTNWDQAVAYPGIRLGHTGKGMGVGGPDRDADFHPQLLRPEPLSAYLLKKFPSEFTSSIAANNFVSGNAANRWNEKYFPLEDLWDMVNW
ncbi:MAG: fibronectin type III domain-containing protein [Treponema sp.]|jgi:hypothetical protein|nr:fibronectin type III domain-containing protein [Treponema sp.]